MFHSLIQQRLEKETALEQLADQTRKYQDLLRRLEEKGIDPDRL